VFYIALKPKIKASKEFAALSKKFVMVTVAVCLKFFLL